LHQSRQKRLRLELIVDHMFEEHTEVLLIDVCRPKNLLFEVRSGASVIVVLRQYIHLVDRVGRYEQDSSTKAALKDALQTT
jgi:hypothetical protein